MLKQNEDIHQMYFVLKTDMISRCTFLNNCQNYNLHELDAVLASISTEYSYRYPQALVIDCSKITRSQRLMLIDSIIGDI